MITLPKFTINFLKKELMRVVMAEVEESEARRQARDLFNPTPESAESVPTLIEPTALEDIAKGEITVNNSNRAFSTAQAIYFTSEYLVKIRMREPETRETVKSALEYGLHRLVNNNISELAKRIGIGRATAYRGIKRLEVGFRDRHTANVESTEQEPAQAEQVLALYFFTPASHNVLRTAYEDLLLSNGVNVTECAERVGTGRATVYRDIRTLKIDLKQLGKSLQASLE